ncbi:MAG: hypothetical protein H0T73_07200 [Ardenticatenales bacterium]|nr:hypothetical protein [Ardenticatenales bacterium]
MTNKSTLHPSDIFWFWLPLATMWLIMSAEQPSITAAVSRLPEIEKNLAAFGLTFSLALIIESPVIMLLTAGTALATHRQAYQRLMTFTHILSLLSTVLHLLLGFSPLYAHILRSWIGVPEEGIIETSRVAFLLMTPWTAMIAYRRLLEGVMIRLGHPKRVTIVIIVRLLATIFVLGTGLILARWQGAYVGGVALSVAVTVGALSAWLLARPLISQKLGVVTEEAEQLTWSRLLHFYAPLALSTLITMVASPILAFGLSSAPLPVKSLAIWPVVTSLVFIGRSFGIAYQEVVVALLKDAQSYAVLRRFTWTLALGSSGAFFLLAATPGAMLWYRNISGLTEELAQMAVWPTLILVLVPGLNAALSWQRGVLIHSKKTQLISVAVALNMAVLVALMVGLPRLFAVPGAILAASAVTISMVVECFFLWWQSRTMTARLEARPLMATE